MTEQQNNEDTRRPVGPTDEPDDTEGHYMNPGAAYEMAKARSKDIERQAREHQRQKEVRTKGK